VAAKTGPLHEGLDKISKILTSMLSDAESRRRERSVAFGASNAHNFTSPRLSLDVVGPRMGDQNVTLIIEWIEMEARSGHIGVLGHGLSHGLQPEHPFVSGKRLSTLDLLSYACTTPPMSTFLDERGLRLADIAEKLLAGFVGMEQCNPFAYNPSHTSSLHGSALHAPGAPLTLTCTIVLSATISLTETHAALFMQWGASSERVESSLVIMRQAAKCLVAKDLSRSATRGESNLHLDNLFTQSRRPMFQKCM
jgi:hypothetical protein